MAESRKTVNVEIPVTRLMRALERLSSGGRLTMEQMDAIDSVAEAIDRAGRGEPLVFREILVTLLEAGFSYDQVKKFVEDVVGDDQRLIELGLYTLQNARREYAQKVYAAEEENE